LHVNKERAFVVILKQTTCLFLLLKLVKMSLLSKVTRCMKTIAPLELAESSWDNVGVLVGK
jgi:hypothetical protein